MNACKFMVMALLALSLVSPVLANRTPDAEEEQVVESVKCGREKDQRKLEVQTRKTGCTLQYLKEGKTNEIAASRRGVDLCQDMLKKVRARLESSGYKCG